ncbi:MAG: hypothetical protein EBS06_06225 [Proteobacteria bacterium]|nr:hypothetical protein [Pseudomonadota bacterium]
MAKKDFEIRFDKARIELNSSLKNLEKIIEEKIQQKQTTEILEDLHIDNSQNLQQEVNNLQQSLAELGQENELLIEENKKLSDSLEKIHSQSSSLIKAVESDLIKIEEIILGEKNG